MPVRTNPEPGDYLSITEAAQYIGVSTRTLLRYEERGLIHPHRLPDNGPRRYLPADLDALVGREPKRDEAEQASA